MRFFRSLGRSFLRYPVNFVRRFLVRTAWRWIITAIVGLVIGGGIINLSVPVSQNVANTWEHTKKQSESMGAVGRIFYDLGEKIVRFFDYQNTIEYFKNGGE